MNNVYVLIASLLLISLILGRLFRKIGLTEILAYIFAGIIIGPILKFHAPKQFFTVVTGLTLALVAYSVGLTFSFHFLKKMGKKIIIILLVEVVITSLVVWLFVYFFTGKLPLSITLASLAPATAPAGTIAVLRDLRAKGRLTKVAVAIVGLDDAAAIVIYSAGIMWTKMLLGSQVDVSSFLIYGLREIFGAVALGAVIGFAVSYLTRRIHLSSDQIFVVCIALAILSWGLADILGVSEILTCMILGTVVINFTMRIGVHSSRLIDNIMTPVFILFFSAIGMEIGLAQLAYGWAIAVVYCLGRSVGKMMGCSLGGILSQSEAKITKYLGIALLNQAGVAVGLAFLAAQELAQYGLGSVIITLMATTTAFFQIVSPLGTQYAVRKAGEANI